jgi:hypothetical protein
MTITVTISMTSLTIELANARAEVSEYRRRQSAVA